MTGERQGDREPAPEPKGSSATSSGSEGGRALRDMSVHESTNRASAAEADHASFASNAASSSPPKIIENDGITQPVSPDQEVGPCDPGLHEDIQGNSLSSVSEAATSTSGSTTGVSQPLMPLIPEDTAVGPVSLLLDGMTQEIIACTVGFTTLSGPLVNKSSIRTVVVNFDDFYRWLQHSVNVFLCDLHDELEVFDLRMSPLTVTKSSKIEYHMQARLVHVAQEACASTMGVDHSNGDEEEDVYDMLCVLEFTDVETQWLGQGTNRRA